MCYTSRSLERQFARFRGIGKLTRLFSWCDRSRAYSVISTMPANLRTHRTANYEPQVGKLVVGWVTMSVVCLCLVALGGSLLWGGRSGKERRTAALLRITEYRGRILTNVVHVSCTCFRDPLISRCNTFCPNGLTSHIPSTIRMHKRYSESRFCIFSSLVSLPRGGQRNH